MTLLQDKVAMLTGASAGIGAATARLLTAHGAAVVLNARQEGPLQTLAAQLMAEGGRVCVVAGDVTRADTHQRCVDAALQHFGGLDIAINNAGSTGAMRPLAELQTNEWDATLQSNLGAAFLAARAQIPAMLLRGGGALVFTSSFVGNSVGLPGMAACGAAKAGLMGLVKGITADYAAQGIRANAVLPGGTLTAMAGDEAQQAWAAGLHAMKRLAQPAEIAAAIVFLASPMASFVAGSALYADGGNAAVK